MDRPRRRELVESVDGTGIGTVGDARITRPGMISLKARTEGILGPVQRSAEIDDFSISIPVLDILSVPESAPLTVLW